MPTTTSSTGVIAAQNLPHRQPAKRDKASRDAYDAVGIYMAKQKTEQSKVVSWVEVLQSMMMISRQPKSFGLNRYRSG
jgi:DNA topoisomerase VI subunit A